MKLTTCDHRKKILCVGHLEFMFFKHSQHSPLSVFICYILHFLYWYNTSFFCKKAVAFDAHIQVRIETNDRGSKGRILKKKFVGSPGDANKEKCDPEIKMRVRFFSFTVSPIVFFVACFFPNNLQNWWILPLMSFLLNQGFFLRRRLDCTMWHGTTFSWEQGGTPKKWTRIICPGNIRAFWLKKLYKSLKLININH